MKFLLVWGGGCSGFFFEGGGGIANFIFMGAGRFFHQKKCRAIVFVAFWAPSLAHCTSSSLSFLFQNFPWARHEATFFETTLSAKGCTAWQAERCAGARCLLHSMELLSTRTASCSWSCWAIKRSNKLCHQQNELGSAKTVLMGSLKTLTSLNKESWPFS